MWQFDWAAAIPNWFIAVRTNITCQHHSATTGEWLSEWTSVQMTDSQLTKWNETTLCSSVRLRQSVVSQLVKKFPSYYGTWRFITLFTKVYHLSYLSWARYIHRIPRFPFSLRSISVFFMYLCLHLSSGLFTSQTLYVFLFSPMCATCPVHLILIALKIWIIFDEEYKSWSFCRLHPEELEGLTCSQCFVVSTAMFSGSLCPF